MSERRPDDLLESKGSPNDETSSNHEASLGDDGPVTPEELADAARLREALDVDAGSTAEALEAVRPLRAGMAAARDALPADVHERLLTRVLGVLPGDGALPGGGAELPSLRAVDEATTVVDRRDAERLRDRLESGLRRDPDAEPDDPIEALVEVASAARSAFAPRPLDAIAAERALVRASLGRAAIHRSSRGGRLGWGLALAAAAAAAVVILPRTGLLPSSDPATASLVPVRSTQELFDPAEPFPREGGASDRIDRIAASRRADLRQNRFARWGIR